MALSEEYRVAAQRLRTAEGQLRVVGGGCEPLSRSSFSLGGVSDGVRRDLGVMQDRFDEMAGSLGRLAEVLEGRVVPAQRYEEAMDRYRWELVEYARRVSVANVEALRVPPVVVVGPEPVGHHVSVICQPSARVPPVVVVGPEPVCPVAPSFVLND